MGGISDLASLSKHLDGYRGEGNKGGPGIKTGHFLLFGNGDDNGGFEGKETG